MDKDVERYFERLEELVERRFTEVKDRQETTINRVGNLEVIAARQEEQIKYHIKRTDIAEDRAEQIRKEAADRASRIEAAIVVQRKELTDQTDARTAKLEAELVATKKEVVDALEPLKINSKATKISAKWLVGTIMMALTILGTVAGWLALRH